MAIREIKTFPHPVLRIKGKPVKKFDKELQELIDDMIDTMREAPGVGLAAPQIGVSQQLVVVEFGDENDDEAPKKLYVLINPEIVKASEDTVTDLEACLSVPELAGEVERYHGVTVKALNRHGQPMKIIADGWLARIFQHEIDHLNGVLYIDRASKIFRPTQEEMANIRD